MNRRNFLNNIVQSGIWVTAAGIIGCGRSPLEQMDEKNESQRWLRDGEPPVETVTLYDTYAMALYFDGGLGPKTGVIKVDYILKGEGITLDFWHGHGGKLHQFSLTKEHYAQFKLKKKVLIQTTIVDDHSHKLFIDFSDPKWRVPGAQPIPVPLGPVPVTRSET